MLCYVNFEMFPLEFIYITLNNLDAIQGIGFNQEKTNYCIRTRGSTIP